MNRLLALILVLAGLALAGCNTVAGAGKDLQSGGETVQEVARDVKEKM